MQKVVGSSPIIRSSRPAGNGGFRVLRMPESDIRTRRALQPPAILGGERIREVRVRLVLARSSRGCVLRLTGSRASHVPWRRPAGVLAADSSAADSSAARLVRRQSLGPNPLVGRSYSNRGSRTLSPAVLMRFGAGLLRWLRPSGWESSRAARIPSQGGSVRSGKELEVTWGSSPGSFSGFSPG
jgi:hypothetical protein